MAKRIRRARLPSPEAIGAVLLERGEQRFAQKKLAIPRHVWAELVGPIVARRTEPRALERGILTVLVASSSWSAELSFLSETLLNRLRARNYTVERLRFVVGTVIPPSRPFEREPDVVPVVRPLPTDLAKTIETVVEDDLRAALTAAARVGLARTRYLEERKTAKKRTP